jgi:hypothetical protein
LRTRAEHKVQTDYCDEPEPAAASILDLVRATVIFEEPYALAAFVKHAQKTLRVVRLKNRFEHDVGERISAARLQQEFYAAEAWGYDDADSVASGDSGRESYDKMYRDVMLNVELPREDGDPFIAELQVALSGISILKKSEQTVYTIMRMKRPADLLGTFVFDHALAEPLSPTSPKYHDAYASTDLGDVAVEVGAAEIAKEQMEAQPAMPRYQEPEIIQSEAPMGIGGMFSCSACEPCEPSSGEPVLVSAMMSREVPDSALAATTAKLDAATARLASMEAELAALREKNERLEALHSAPA